MKTTFKMKKVFAFLFMIFTVMSASSQDIEKMTVSPNAKVAIGAFHIETPIYEPAELDSLPFIEYKKEREKFLKKIRKVNLKKYGLTKNQVIFAFIVDDDGILKNVHVWVSDMPLLEEKKKEIQEIFTANVVSPPRYYAIISGFEVKPKLTHFLNNDLWIYGVR